MAFRQLIKLLAFNFGCGLFVMTSGETKNTSHNFIVDHFSHIQSYYHTSQIGNIGLSSIQDYPQTNYRFISIWYCAEANKLLPSGIIKKKSSTPAPNKILGKKQKHEDFVHNFKKFTVHEILWHIYSRYDYFCLTLY